MQVDFVIVGAQKSGTTSLASQLALHPQVAFSRTKEPGYFNEQTEWRAGLGEYHNLFSPEAGQLLGEASTMYTFYPESLDTHKRLHAYNPEMKIIYIMRHPVNRIVSHYAHNLVRGIEKNLPEVAVARDARYVNRSRYAAQIEPYIELFDRDQVLLLCFEDYIADNYGTLQQIAGFLEISEDGFASADTVEQHETIGRPYLKYQSVEKVAGSDAFQLIRKLVPASIRQPIRHRFFSNKLESKPEFSAELRNALWRLVEDDVDEIEILLGRPIGAWIGETSGGAQASKEKTVPQLADSD